MPLMDVLQSSPFLLPFADAIVKATILLAAAGLVTTALRRSSAASRHLVWTCALVGALALPLLSLALPRWQMPIVTITTPQHVGATPIEQDDATSRQMATTMRARLEGGREAPSEPGAAVADAGSMDAIAWPMLLAAIWLAGAVLVLARLALGVAVVQWLSRRTETVSDAPWLRMARETAAQLGLGRVIFRRSRVSSMPMAWGIFRPSVLLPAEADVWPQDRLRVVLLHELAHVRRADCLTHMLAQAACALYWFNPLAWMASRRLRAERERACDDLVLAFGMPGPDYADQLLEIARTMGSGRLSSAVAGASLAMARPSQLEGRLMSILDPSVPRTGVSRTRTALACAFALVTITPLASVQPWVQAAPAMVPPLPPQTPVAAPKPHTDAGARPTDGVEQRVVNQEIVQSAVQGATQGAIQGVLQGILQSVPDAVTGVIDGMSWQRPNPNPNPNPNPDPNPNSDPDEDEQASKADPKVVAALTAALQDTDKEVRESAMQALVRLRDPGIFDPLVQALKDASPDVRENAAFGLGQLRDKRAVAPLSGALKDSNAGVREKAVFALGQLRDPGSVDGLVGALSDSSASVREQAAFALGQIRDERAVQPLSAALQDSVADVREQAAFALGQLRARSAVDALIGVTKDADADVREQAAFALGQIRDPRAIDALTAALKDASASVRQQAAFALGQLAR